jgi:hypothetical protein
LFYDEEEKKKKKKQKLQRWEVLTCRLSLVDWPGTGR